MVKRGRPSRYTSKLARLICAEMATGRSLRSICEPDDMPHEATVRGWNLDDVEGFSTQYARARELQHLALIEEIDDLANEPPQMIEVVTETANGTRVEKRVDPGWERYRQTRIDTKKWNASKILKAYRDKVDLEHSGKVDIGALLDARRKRATQSKT